MKPIELTSANFADETAAGLTVVDFWASWCGPCKMLAPIVEELSGELTDVKFGKVNVDKEQELAAVFQVDAIPTLYFIKDGKAINKMVGLTAKETLKKMIEACQRA